jgi:hypothetical protein
LLIVIAFRWVAILKMILRILILLNILRIAKISKIRSKGYLSIEHQDDNKDLEYLRKQVRE